MLKTCSQCKLHEFLALLLLILTDERSFTCCCISSPLFCPLKGNFMCCVTVKQCLNFMPESIWIILDLNTHSRLPFGLADFFFTKILSILKYNKKLLLLAILRSTPGTQFTLNILHSELIELIYWLQSGCAGRNSVMCGVFTSACANLQILSALPSASPCRSLSLPLPYMKSRLVI